MKVMTKKRSCQGFSLAEVLIALLILLMVSSIVAAGIPVAARAYHRVVDTANAQVLLSTAMTRLREELSVALGVTVSEGTISYTSDMGLPAQIYKQSSGDADKMGIHINRDSGSNKYDTLLVSRETANKNLYITYNEVVGPNNGVLTITDLKVFKDGDTTNALASVPEYKIRVLSAS